MIMNLSGFDGSAAGGRHDAKTGRRWLSLSSLLNLGISRRIPLEGDRPDPGDDSGQQNTAFAIAERLERDILTMRQKFNSHALGIEKNTRKILDLAEAGKRADINADYLQREFRSALRTGDFLINQMIEIAGTDLPNALESLGNLNPRRAAELRNAFSKEAPLEATIQTALRDYNDAIQLCRAQKPGIFSMP